MHSAQLNFDAAAHRYEMGGSPLISVTQALKAAGLIDYRGLSPDYAARGTAVHAACERVLSGQHVEPDPVLSGYLAALDSFLLDCDYEHEASEVRGYNSVYAYAGTIDILGRVNHRSAIIDIKTGSPAKWHALQLGGYRALELSPGLDICTAGRALFCLYLAGDGSYSLKEFPAPSVLTRDFLTLLQAQRLKEIYL